MESRILFYTFLTYVCHSITMLKAVFILAVVVNNFRLLTTLYANSIFIPGVTLHERKLKKGLDRKVGNYARGKDFKSGCWRSTNPIRNGERQ